MTADKSYEALINYIKDKIISHAYKIGDKLPPERELAEQLNISRNSTREGLRILDRMGLIEVRHGSGNYIANNFSRSLVEIMSLMYSLDLINIRELMEFRYALELESLSLAIQKATTRDIAELEHFAAMLRNCESEKIKVIYDKKIHYGVAGIGKNAYILNNLTSFDNLMEFYVGYLRGKIFENPNNQEGLQKSHEDIVISIGERDFIKGKDALDRHFAYIFEIL
ncbi:MAG: GntR family transcriptional regulator [Fusobacteriaceae bacterium]|nr:GntR family transcriptional regulator [Fusobacteriaceae bacterium]